jgi:GTP-binding protein
VKILSADFVTSVALGGALPSDTRDVFAFVGRSNVGKSSLINALVKLRVARSGSTPGTTRLLNVYRVKISGPPRGTTILTFVDLPGYGYARGGDRTREEFDQLTSSFFAGLSAPGDQPSDRPHLAGVSLVVDARHPGLQTDLEAHAWLVNQDYPVLVVATKGDRMNRSARQRAFRAHEEALGRTVMPVSSKTGEGTAPLWTALRKLA